MRFSAGSRSCRWTKVCVRRLDTFPSECSHRTRSGPRPPRPLRARRACDGCRRSPEKVSIDRLTRIGSNGADCPSKSRVSLVRIYQDPRPEERAAQTSLRSLRKLECAARVSKDGCKRYRASLHASRRRYAPPQHEACGFQIDRFDGIGGLVGAAVIRRGRNTSFWAALTPEQGHSFFRGGSQAMSEGQVTTDHNKIRHWAE